MRDFLKRLDCPDKDEDVVNALEPLIVEPANRMYERDEHPWDGSASKPEDFNKPIPWEELHPAGHDPKARLAVQDEEGVVA